MRRGLLIASLLLAWLAQSSVAVAASDLELKHAADGTLVVVGSGWHRGQELVVSLGQPRFGVRADASGDFELATGLASFNGEFAIHHMDAPELALVPLAAATPHPLAVLFAWSMAEGAALLGVVTGFGLVGAGILRRKRASR